MAPFLFGHGVCAFSQAEDDILLAIVSHHITFYMLSEVICSIALCKPSSGLGCSLGA